MVKESVSTLIKTKRKAEKMTQQELANKIGVSLMTVVRWENGPRTPNSALIPQLAEALHTSVSYLMGLDSENTTSKDISIKQSEMPSMAYWGEVLDNAEKTAKSGKNLNTIYTLLTDAVGVIKSAMAHPYTLDTSAVPV